MDYMQTRRVVEVLPVDALVVLGREFALHSLECTVGDSLRHACREVARHIFLILKR